MKTGNINKICMMIAMIAIVSCKKNDLLNLTPPTQLSDASYWNTPADLVTYANNFYNYQDVFYLGGNIGNFDIDDNSDNLLPTRPDNRLDGLNTVVANSSYPDWAGIYDANYFLANYQRVKGDPSVINPSVGEAYFFRAQLYFNALQLVGGVPWINKPLQSTDTALIYAPRQPRNILADSIVSDLNRAIALLPSKGGTTQQLRYYKEYAEAFLSRVCLYEGTWEKYHAGDAFGVSGQNGSTFLQEAADAAQACMNSGIFGLDNVRVPNGYFNLFNLIDYSASKEVIFWKAYNQTPDFINNAWQNFYQLGSTGSAADGLSQSLINDYLCIDGKPISVSPLYKGDDTLLHVIANRDPRLHQTIFTYGDTVVTNNPGSTPLFLFTYPAFNTGNNICTTGYQIKKGLSYNANLNTYTGGSGTQGLIYMRYAEVLLNYAEAKAELGTITQGDIDLSINLLRDRVGMPHLNMASITTDPHWIFPELPPIINEVRRERRVELSCEGFRLNDILRWAAAPDLIVKKQPAGAASKQFLTVPLQGGGSFVVGSNIFLNAQEYIIPYGNNPNVASGYGFNVGRDYLLPIPLAQTVANPKIKQNPGW